MLLKSWKMLNVLEESIWTTNAPSRIITSASAERSAARYAAVSLLISCSSSCVQGSSSVPLINQKALQWRYHRWQGQPSLHNQCCLFQLPGLLPHQHFLNQDGSVQDTSASLPFYLSAHHPVCAMTVVLAGFSAWKILAGPLSLSSMQCKAAKTTSSRCGWLSGKISEPSVVAQTHAACSFAEEFWLVLFSFGAFPQQSCYIAVSQWWWLS